MKSRVLWGSRQFLLSLPLGQRLATEAADRRASRGQDDVQAGSLVRTLEIPTNYSRNAMDNREAERISVLYRFCLRVPSMVFASQTQPTGVALRLSPIGKAAGPTIASANIFHETNDLW